MRKRHRTSQNVTKNPPDEAAALLDSIPAPARRSTGNRESGALEDLLEAKACGTLPPGIDRLPWETSNEHAAFFAFLLCPQPRSVRKAYKHFCEANGRTPAKDPPSSWYKLYRGEYSAFTRAERQLKAINRAGALHRRYPDWERLEQTGLANGELGTIRGEIGRVQDSLTLIEYAFHSLAIDLEGNPIPGLPTWDERAAAYWAAVESGKIPAPDEDTPDLEGLEQRVKTYQANAAEAGRA